MSKICAALLFGAVSLSAGTYDVDATHSQVAFSVKHLGISNVRGQFRKFDGSYELDEKTLAIKKLVGTVDVNSIDTGVDDRDKHLRGGDFFGVLKFPAMKLEETAEKADGKKSSLNANITIKDVTKPVKFVVEKGGVAKDPWGNTRSSIRLEGIINRKDFGLTWNKAMEAGGFVVGDEVKVVIELEGILKK